jgi:hypothetical protein
VTLLYDRLEAGACVALALVLVFAVDQWEAWYPVLFVPLLTVVRRGRLRSPSRLRSWRRSRISAASRT